MFIARSALTFVGESKTGCPVSVCVCLCVTDFREFLYWGYVRVTHGTEQCRFERPQMKVFEKTVQKQATLWITVGKRTGFEPLFGPLLDTFLNKSLNFFDLVFSRYSDPSGDFAPLPCTVYLVYNAGSADFLSVWTIFQYGNLYFLGGIFAPKGLLCRGAQNLCSSGVCPSVRPSVATLFGPGIWFVHDWYWTVRGSKKWSKLCKSTKMDHEFGSFTTGIGRFEVQKWVRNSHNRHFGATLPCGCYLVISLVFDWETILEPQNVANRMPHYNMSGSKFPFFHQKSPKICVFAVDKRLQSTVTCKNLFFASFLEVSSGICVQNVRFRNKFLPFAL